MSNDSNKHFPTVTLLLIAINIIIFFLLAPRPNFAEIINRYGFTPNNGIPLPNLISAMFLHGDFLHLASNMWFLWIFGYNLEGRLGKFFFLIFFILGGLIGFFVHAETVSSFVGKVPCIGASGAISALIGGYVVFFHNSQVRFIPFSYSSINALALIGLWFVYQAISIFIASHSITSAGVAYGAHIGGFAFGLMTMNIAKYAFGFKE